MSPLPPPSSPQKRRYLRWLLPHALAATLMFVGLFGSVSREFGVALFAIGVVIDLAVWMVAVHDRGSE